MSGQSRKAIRLSPGRLFLGNSTLAIYRAKAALFEKEIAEWHEVITGTDHDDVAEAKHWLDREFSAKIGKR